MNDWDDEDIRQQDDVIVYLGIGAVFLLIITMLIIFTTG